MTEFYDNKPKWVGGVPDPALVALGESRARYGDIEALLVEAEAVIQKVRATLTSPDLDDDEVIDRALDWLDPLVAPERSVVLADHDKEVAARAWDEGFVASETHKGVVAMEGQPWRVTTPANPYRSGSEGGDNR